MNDFGFSVPAAFRPIAETDVSIEYTTGLVPFDPGLTLYKDIVAESVVEPLVAVTLTDALSALIAVTLTVPLVSMVEVQLVSVLENVHPLSTVAPL